MCALADGGILHRDLKPNNVLVTADWTQAKIADFSLSKMLHQDQPTEPSQQRFGNVFYTAPEVRSCMIQAQQPVLMSAVAAVFATQVLLGEQVNQPSMDIYSASLIMWQLFCARRFSPQGELCAHLLKVVHEDWRPPLPKHLPRGLGGLLQRRGG